MKYTNCDSIWIIIFLLRNKDGTIYEHGPRTVRPVGPQGANTLQMIQELGLVDRSDLHNFFEYRLGVYKLW